MNHLEISEKDDTIWIMYQIEAPILFNKKIIEGYYLMELYAPQISQEAKPGQFIHLRCTQQYDPLLRRPFSIYKAEDETLQVLYKVVGKGTYLLSEKIKGEKIDILGPLGRGFETNLNSSQEVILIGGGIGIAPLYFLSTRLSKFPLTVFLGVKTKNKILCKREFTSQGFEVKIATDDGSKGFKGLVSDFFFSYFFSLSSSLGAVYACGPLPMLKKISEFSLKHNIFCQVSLEQRMGCGIGACQGCVIKGKDKYLRVCKEGPVFKAGEIDWSKID